MDPIESTVSLFRDKVEIVGSLRVREIQSSAFEVRVTFEKSSFIGEGSDCLEALLSLRRQLEPMGLLIGVMGARKDVWPSGKQRNIARGRKAYRMTMGTPVGPGDGVETFARSDEPATIDAQEKFRDDWYQSLRDAPAHDG